MLSWVVGILFIIVALCAAVLIMTANAMTDNPSEKASQLPALIIFVTGVIVIIGHLYKVW